MANPNPSPATRFKPGEKPPGNGRPREARDRITRKFLTALADDFEQHGVEAIVKLRETDVGKYIQAVGAIVPKEVEITRPLEGVTDDDLAQIIEHIRGQIPEDDQPKTVN